MGPEHYLSKIERNANVVVNLSPDRAMPYVRNIQWARDLSKRLDNLDYPQRQEAIARIHAVMDQDYQTMGYSLEENNTMGGR